MTDKFNSLGNIYKIIKLNYKNYHWLKENLFSRILGLYFRLKKNEGIYVMEEDWDNLIVLDACRHDYFKEVTGLNADYRISRGSSTGEFLVENFSSENSKGIFTLKYPSIYHAFKDTVAIAGSPCIDQNKQLRNSFYKSIPVWKFGWDEKLDTVHPKTMVKYAIDAERKYPNKRLIIWFLQPHGPYIGSPGIEFERKKPGSFYRKKYGIQKLREAYKKNLEVVVPYALELARTLKGKTVITSDHGEGLETRWLWFPFPHKVLNHPTRVYIPELVKVPWLVFEGDERKEIVDETESERIKRGIKGIKNSKKNI